MADVTLRGELVVGFTLKEFRLVTLALGGKLTRQQDKLDAMALGVRLLEQRQSTLSSILEQSDGAAKAAKLEYEQAVAEHDRQVALAAAPKRDRPPEG
jgi:outer membrane murein-binding lipoprotein Lpp